MYLCIKTVAQLTEQSLLVRDDPSSNPDIFMQHSPIECYLYRISKIKIHFQETSNNLV